MININNRFTYFIEIITNFKTLLMCVLYYIRCIILFLKGCIIIKLKSFIDISSVSKTLIVNYESFNDKISINYKNYSTKKEDFKTWIDIIQINSKIPKTFFFFIIIAIYIIGLIYTYLINFHIKYLNSLPIYLGLIGVSITLFCIKYGSNRIHKSYCQIRPCFFITDSLYKIFLEEWFLRLSDIKATIKLSIFFSVIFIIIISIPFYNNDIIIKYKLSSFQINMFLTNDWFENPYKDFKFIFLSIWAIIITFPLITAARILIINFFFLLDLRNIPIIPIPNLIRIRLKSITSLYFIISFFWFIGVILFGILFFDNVDLISIIYMSLFSILGFLTFFTPQIIYRHLIIQSENTASKWILASFYEKLNINLSEQLSNKFIDTTTASQRYKLDTLVDYFDASIPVNRWIYSHTQVISFIFGQIITILSPKLLKWLNLFT